MQLLEGKKVVVTGGGRGIGRSLALGLAEHGADVGIVYRNRVAEAERVASEIKQLGRRAWVFKKDLAEVETLPAFAGELWDEMDSIDVLVNNAGIAHFEVFDEISVETWRHTFQVNVESPFFLAQAIALQMIERENGGRIINISSKNGFVAEAGLAHYNASKGALELLTQSLAIELGSDGITVNTVAPGVIDTDIGEDFDVDRERFRAYYEEHIPLQNRYGRPEECVGAVLLLASDLGSYITGQHIIVDGGVLSEQVPRLQFLKPDK